MNLQNNTATPQEEVVSLRDVIVSITEWTKYLLLKWKVILLACIIGAGLGFLAAFFSKSNYTAELSFVLEDSKSNALGAYAGIASQFGIDLGGGGSGAFAGDNIVEFLHSRLMVEKALLATVSMDGKTKTLADVYMDIEGLRKKWKNPELQKLQFPSGKERSGFSRLQDSVLFEICQLVTKKNLDIAKPDKKLNFVNVVCTSPNEIFSKTFVETLVKDATVFYVATKTQRSKSSVDKLQVKADSIVVLLNAKTFSVAAAQDLNQNPARRVATVGTQMAMRDQAVLQTMYAEVVKNLELSKIAMAQETPIIQVIDRPILPLKKERLGFAKAGAIGGILLGFIAVVLLIIRRILKKAMAPVA